MRYPKTMLSVSPRSIKKWWKRAGSLVGFRSQRKPIPAGALAPHGRWVQASYTNDAGTRAYKTYIPDRDSGKHRPLVVMLHGCKQNADDFAAGTQMNLLADELGFIVAYPEQAFRANGTKCWNWFRTTNQKRETGEPSLIAGITREVIAKYDVDPRRVYIAGLSAGGAMATIMGCTYPDLYAAIGVHSGLPFGAAHDTSSALAAMRGRQQAGAAPLCGESLPTIVFHGDGDTTVHPKNGELVIGERGKTKSVEKGEERGRAYTRTVRADGSEHWLVHGAGHAWSGGSLTGSYSDPKGPDAARKMVDFFSDRRL
jgi:poly(hydroxyalkanoate) depolymerase family esterase